MRRAEKEKQLDWHEAVTLSGAPGLMNGSPH